MCKVFKENFWLENSKSMLISVNVVQMCWYTIVALLCLLYLRKCAWQKSGFNVWIWIALCQEMKRLKHDEWSYWKSIDTHRICERLERQKHDNMQLFPTKLWPSSVSHLSFKVEFTTAQTYTHKKNSPQIVGRVADDARNVCSNSVQKITEGQQRFSFNILVIHTP